MAEHRLITYPSPVLRQLCSVVDFDDIEHVLKEMTCVLELSPGAVGLAAPQVGLNVRAIWVNALGMLINPSFSAMSHEMLTETEGCLSIPGVAVNVSRHRHVKVLYQDREGKDCSLNCSDWIARIVQHEIDHLDGKLMIDHLSRKQRKIIDKKFKRT